MIVKNIYQDLFHSGIKISKKKTFLGGFAKSSNVLK